MVASKQIGSVAILFEDGSERTLTIKAFASTAGNFVTVRDNHGGDQGAIVIDDLFAAEQVFDFVKQGFAELAEGKVV